MKSLPMLATTPMLSSLTACAALPEATTQATRTCPDAAGAESEVHSAGSLKPGQRLIQLSSQRCSPTRPTRNHAIAASESGARS